MLVVATVLAVFAALRVPTTHIRPDRRLSCGVLAYVLHFYLKTVAGTMHVIAIHFTEFHMCVCLCLCVCVCVCVWGGPLVNHAA